MILKDIIREIEKSRGPVTVRQLARRLGVEESALEGMLDFLERKGRLTLYRRRECGGCPKTSCLGCALAGGTGGGRSDAEGGRGDGNEADNL